MERRPNREGESYFLKQLGPQIVFASSVPDLVENGARLIDEMDQERKEWKNSLHPAVRAFDNVAGLPMRLIDRVTSNPYSGRDVIETNAIVMMPKVRHFPAYDRDLPENQIKISDPLGEVVVNLPNKNLLEYLKKLRIGFYSHEQMRAQSWTSEILLYSDFSLKVPDNHTLIYIFDSNIPEFERQKVARSLGRLLGANVPTR
jgi:hypothetical protein